MIEPGVNARFAGQEKSTKLLEVPEVRALFGYNVLDIAADPAIVRPRTPKSEHEYVIGEGAIVHVGMIAQKASKNRPMIWAALYGAE